GATLHECQLDAPVAGADASRVDPDVVTIRIEAGKRVDHAHTAQDHVQLSLPRSSHAPSTPSISRRRTATRSPTAVGTFLPTYVARSGSSRCPRSMSASTSPVAGRP